MSSTRWPGTPSLATTGIVAALIGAYNLLAVTASAVATANRFAGLPGYTFPSAFGQSWSAYVGMDGLGIAVPVAVGAALVALSRFRFGAPDSGTGRPRTAAALATVAGVLCWLPPVGLALLGIVRLLFGASPAPWSNAFYLALVVAGGALFALADVLDSSPDRAASGDADAAPPNP